MSAAPEAAWGREAAGCGLNHCAPHPRVPLSLSPPGVGRWGRRCQQAAAGLGIRLAASPLQLGVGRVYMPAPHSFPFNGQLIFR